MRRADREISDPVLIRKTIDDCSICRIGFNDNGEVYIIPMNFGYTCEGDRYVFYFHVFVSTKDVCASSGGPFNFPMSMFAAPLFAFFCLVELGAALLFRVFCSTRGKVNPTAERRKNQNMSTPEHD